MRSLLVIFLAFCTTISDGFGNMLVQGRADTIRTLRDIVLKTSQQTLENRQLSWESPPQQPKHHRKILRGRRHISNVVVESGQCDHVELVDCSDFETDEMTCMLTATGMTCCVCTGALRATKRTLF